MYFRLLIGLHLLWWVNSIGGFCVFRITEKERLQL